MGKSAADATIDGGLDYIQTNVKALYVCTTDEPATFADASETTAYMMAKSTSLTSASFTKANGDSSGRKITIAQQSSLSITQTTIAGHIALTSTDTLLLVTTCTTQVLTTGNTVTVPGWDVEIADPT
jgi:hypothetical protein